MLQTLIYFWMQKESSEFLGAEIVLLGIMSRLLDYLTEKICPMKGS
jgi:hypothetical protein